ncbi:MAG: hypothetical protein OXT73_10345 [Bacteroidota bacterium]|nr:hypothetical protein [Bacteroidota bacterium]
MRLPRIPAFSVLLLLLLSGCAASEPLAELPDESATPASPLDGFTSVIAADTEVTVRQADGASTRLDVPGDASFVSASPDGSWAVVGLDGGLVAFSRDGSTTRVLESGTESLSYTGAWSRDGARFHYGFYVPAGDAMGAGNIKTWNIAADSLTPVGCSASKAVLSALPDGSLLVRNTDNIYQVEADGCGTIRSVDARKLYHVSASPDGEHLAYILRDLVYNRERRAYEPDSTLYIESTAGSDPVKVIGDKYSPRNISWSRDGSELLYDVAPPSEEANRTVSVYSVAEGRSAYVIPPGGSEDMTHGQFSPSGDHVLFKSAAGDGSSDWQVKMAGSQFSQALPVENVASLYWIDDRHILVRSIDGSSHLVSVAGAPTATALKAPVVWLWSN